MIDSDAEVALIDEILEIAQDPHDVARIPELEEILSRADANGDTPHAAIFGRSLLAGYLTYAHAADIAPALGLFAETQQLLREHADELISDVFVPILTQNHVTITLLLEDPAVPLDRVETVRANYEQMCLQNGMTLRGAYALAMRIAIRRGDHAAVEHNFAQLQAQPRDIIVIMDTVEDAVSWYADRGMDEEALLLAQRATPETETHYYRSVQTAALLPALRLGRADLAAHLYDESWDPDEIDSDDAPRLTYLTLVERYDDAMALLPKVMAPQSYDTERSRALCAEHAVVLLSHVSAAGHGAKHVPGLDAGVDELLARYREVAEKAARTLDRVNNLDFALRRLHAFWAKHIPTFRAPEQAVSTSTPPTAPPR